MGVMIPNYSFFPHLLATFCLIYLIGKFIVLRNWSPKHHNNALSCFVSLFHGTPSVLLALAAILNHPDRGFAMPNTKFQNFVLDFSIAYFTVDLLHFLVFIPTDYIFIAHHLATLFVFITCRCLVAHGADAVLVLLVLAEITSPCHNVWALAGLRKEESALAARIHKHLSVPFYALYTAMRVVLGPLFLLAMCCYYFSGKARDVIPIWVSISWIFVVGLAILGSIVWISVFWIELYIEKSINTKKYR